MGNEFLVKVQFKPSRSGIDVPSDMSRLERVRQWATFARTWHIFDAQWQNPFQSSKRITPILEGKNKPIYHPTVDAGDHVVVINSRHICMIGTEWQERVYGPPSHLSGGSGNGSRRNPQKRVSHGRTA